MSVNRITLARYLIHFSGNSFLEKIPQPAPMGEALGIEPNGSYLGGIGYPLESRLLLKDATCDPF